MIGKLMKGFEKNNKGFTLVELMVVVVIIGILVAIAVPVYNSSQTKAKENAHKANIRILEGAAAQCITDNGEVTTTWSKSDDPPTKDDEDWGHYLESWPVNPLPDTYPDSGEYSVEITSGKIVVKTGTTPVDPPGNDSNGG